MISIDEYKQRFQSLIKAWEPFLSPDRGDSHDKQVILTDGSRRLVKSSGTMCITVYGENGGGGIDPDFQVEEKLMMNLTQSDMGPMQLQKQKSPLALPKETADLIKAGVSENTLRNYRFWSREIETWLSGRTLNDGLLAEYITHLHQADKSPATISQAVAAVRWVAKNNGVEIVGEVTQRTLAGIRREGKDRGRGQVDGLNWSDVERVCAFAEMDSSVAGLRDSALIRLMSDCLLRVSEAVAVNVEDLKEKTLLVSKSKTDQEGVGEMLYVTSDTRRCINRYLKRAGIEGGALFRSVRRGDHIQTGRLSSRSARRQIQYWAELAGVEGFISGHSLRVGSAVSLAQAGASVVDMQTAGRWKSSQMPAHYAKAQLAERGAIARFKEKTRG